MYFIILIMLLYVKVRKLIFYLITLEIDGLV